ncbi:FtsH-binding integral membrane protein [Streptomyces achromogenes]|uniref:FtsH-binding integral membrane protein n=1 Tax=Streptomyces achromogenes TaxID=67255 RepID=A0ABU0Q0W9_STRAH|nr:hypothetical protein [Streptomyces achromogenes]MDQ0684310.1 FtsH-binding integral membrane protein [Streptomyces achromogenes]
MTMPTTAMAAGTERRLAAGWFQRFAWVVLAWGSLGLLVWVPFLYVAIRRKHPSDWAAFASFTLYECVSLPWAMNTADGDGDPFLGIAFMVTLLTATGLLLFAMFDKKPPHPPTAMPYGQPQYQQQHPQQGYQYGR